MLMYSEAILISGGSTATTGLGFTYRESNLNFYTKIYSAMNNICHVEKSDETCIEDQWIFLGFLFRKDGILVVAGARVVMDLVCELE